VYGIRPKPDQIENKNDSALSAISRDKALGLVLTMNTIII